MKWRVCDKVAMVFFNILFHSISDGPEESHKALCQNYLHVNWESSLLPWVREFIWNTPDISGCLVTCWRIQHRVVKAGICAPILWSLARYS